MGLSGHGKRRSAKPEAVVKMFKKKHGTSVVFHDSSDPGASKEATAAGKQVDFNPGAVPKAVRKVLIKAGIQKASDEYSTDPGGLKGIIPDNKLKRRTCSVTRSSFGKRCLWYSTTN